MKKFLFSALLFVGTVAAGCSSDSSEEETLVPELTLTPNTDITFAGAGGEASILVETNLSSWEASVDQDWVTAQKEGNSIIVAATANQTVEEKVATLTVTATEGSYYITKQLRILQDSGEEPATDLSASATSNCYVVTSGGKYTFNATVRGNGATTEGLDAPTAVAGTQAKVVWQTVAGMVSDLTLEDGKIQFTLANQPGNAVIAACDANGEIVWSWHIWYPREAVSGIATQTGYEIMNLNLGALTAEVANVESYGLLYQWGRKDPFTAAPTLTGTTSTVGAPVYDQDGNAVKFTNSSWGSVSTNTLEYAIAHPTVCLSNYAQYSTSRDWLQASLSNDALWGNPKGNEKDSSNNLVNKGSKSFYDPCPVGWRVPAGDVFKTFTSSGGYAWTISDFDIADTNSDGQTDINDYRYGWTFNLGNGKTAYFPAATRYDGSYAMLMGSMSGYWGNYWGNSPYEGAMFSGAGYTVLAFQTKDTSGNDMITVSPSAGGGRADAYSIRCIKE
jgi:hypothetical protein